MALICTCVAKRQNWQILNYHFFEQEASFIKQNAAGQLACWFGSVGFYAQFSSNPQLQFSLTPPTRAAPLQPDGTDRSRALTVRPYELLSRWRFAPSGVPGRVENRFHPALPHQTVHAVFPHTAFRCSSLQGMHFLPTR
jgi:hypothetical protein